ncbi:ATP synthase mitochondrial F1 complex assembly factor 2 [Frankliniella fusca]|uniref:ATP synthase mitochondrial F1 complex assembly factor 2 n=1 Tax=Frankliniella fusca TaxID=407009 RepID=A0AAE1GTQ2_9NEOP|nr:ATP synthase mitochondrial F1 complex assembly factor 2 [Frankliniella fusca]
MRRLSIFRNGLQLLSPAIGSKPTLFQQASPQFVFRCYAAPPKRFYKHTGVLYCDGQYEITLDQRKLKTPKGTVFRVKSEPLALAVALEWDAQKERILQTDMHLSSLCNTAIDNPNHVVKFDAVQQLLSFLETDTILYHSADVDNPNAKALYDMQVREWNPIIDWVNEKFGVDLQPTRDIGSPHVSDESKAVIQRHLLSYNDWAIHGFCFAVETLKSLILTLACVERLIPVEKAVLLSRLEEEYQSGYWGRVEWAHDLNQQQMQGRVAAAVLFIHLNSTSSAVRRKNIP